MSRRSRVRGAPSVALLLVGAVALAGCGIEPTAVVESGRAANVPVAAPQSADVLYFVAPDGRLAPSVLRDPRMSTGALLSRLLSGPGTQERGSGLSSELPARTDKMVGPVRVEYRSAKQVTVRLPYFLDAELSDTAKDQLVCTAAVSLDASAKSEVVLVTEDGPMSPLRCPLAR
ncbi:hypothetical protein ACIQWR_15825 [Streptomyces sp. NPDC098789]|uniref:hypothetical protein n=1 Tax=Streptomyces sp. NPDC098789 TaxID=3366098 RepID=UPI0037F4D703